jgi:hypothetical protein
MSGKREVVLKLLLPWLLMAAACDPSRFIDLASDGFEAGAADAQPDARPPDGQIADAALPDAHVPDASSAPVARCGKGPCACDDRLDNDGDGLIDGLDPECTGALDEDESSFATGKPSKANNCRDCFWDEDMGTGNDACRYASACLRGAAPGGNGNCSSCQVSQACVKTCAARTPSGCDCFGCCDIALSDGRTATVELSDRCSLAKLDDPSACPPCRKSSQCGNPCGRCELCLGRTLRDLPADCSMTTEFRCEERQAPCDTSGNCGADQYCQQGCCYGLLL